MIFAPFWSFSMASGICFPIALNLARHAFLIGPMDSDGPCWTTCNRTFSTKSSIINFSARSISPVKTQARSCQSTCGESLPCAIFFTLLVIAHNLKKQNNLEESKNKKQNSKNYEIKIHKIIFFVKHIQSYKICYFSAMFPAAESNRRRQPFGTTPWPPTRAAMSVSRPCRPCRRRK